MKIEANTSLKSVMSKQDINELIRREAEAKGMDVTDIEYKVTKTPEGKVTKLEAHISGYPNSKFKKGV